MKKKEISKSKDESLFNKSKDYWFHQTLDELLSV